MKFFKKTLFFAVLLALTLTAFAACQKKDEPKSSGSVTFTLEVVPKSSESKTFTIKTEKATVGEALLDEGLIEGEVGQYGLMVTVVNGITADYNADGTYWAFYVGGEYAMQGVDSTKPVEGEVYSFKQE